ncbi:hypothetical protein GWI33_004711 [Rhynchophorus ferrugineus]|uniref:Uncharacterized protein n=1 Tax=Rhynchophorus ferrugineus TaxID=354439 RepID=A0A834IZ64_RHYFE|nr:hypothetical protein GWI33_004711 [Rhynchophorus ferrugineus]
MSNIFRFGLIVIVFVYWAQSDGPLTPDSENWDNQEEFLNELLEYSGLSKIGKNFTVCTDVICNVNANGNIVWEIREQLYENNLMQSNGNESIDGCLKTNSDSYHYNECMEKVRKNMLTYLTDHFQDDFGKQFQCNNETILKIQLSENCIGSTFQ